jgi:hypothetical protein
VPHLEFMSNLADIDEGLGDAGIETFRDTQMNGVRSHAVIGNQSSGLKSRPGNCSFTPVVLRSSTQVIVHCKFCEGKATGRNESESVLASLTNRGC